MKKKTKEYITFIPINGKPQKRTIYVDDNGAKYIYNQRGFWTLEDFVRTRKVIKA